jgi:hypothetical protein
MDIVKITVVFNWICYNSLAIINGEIGPLCRFIWQSSFYIPNLFYLAFSHHFTKTSRHHFLQLALVII